MAVRLLSLDSAWCAIFYLVKGLGFQQNLAQRFIAQVGTAEEVFKVKGQRSFVQVCECCSDWVVLFDGVVSTDWLITFVVLCVSVDRLVNNICSSVCQCIYSMYVCSNCIGRSLEWRWTRLDWRKICQRTVTATSLRVRRLLVHEHCQQ